MAGPVRTPPMHQTRSLIAEQSSLPSTSASTPPPQDPPPRPCNPWIIFRNDKLKDPTVTIGPDGKPLSQAEFSKVVAQLWRSIPPATREYYERLADEKKAEHLAKYPDYRYQPVKKAERKRIRAERKQLQKATKAAAKAAEKESKKRSRAQPRQQIAPEPSTSATPPAPSPLSSQTHAFSYPPMPEGAVRYPIEMFGAAGPSPPVSVADSPASSTTPESTSDDANDTTTRTQIQSAFSNRNANPYLTYFSGGSDRLLYTPASLMVGPVTPLIPVPPKILAQEPTVVETPSTLVSSITTQPEPQLALADEQVTMPSTSSQDPFYSQDVGDMNQFSNVINDTLQVPLSETVTFNYTPMNGCFDNVDAFNLTSDVFGLDNFPLDMLNAQPEGELGINFGSYGATTYQAGPPDPDLENLLQTSAINTWLSAPEFCQNIDLSLGPTILQEAYYEQQQPQQVEWPPLAAPSSTSSSSSLQTALSTDLINTDTNSQSASSTSYAPPSGATMSSNRRVGGSWKPPIFPPSHEGSMDLVSA